MGEWLILASSRARWRARFQPDSPGDKGWLDHAGKFGERWRDLAGFWLRRRGVTRLGETRSWTTSDKTDSRCASVYVQATESFHGAGMM